MRVAFCLQHFLSRRFVLVFVDLNGRRTVEPRLNFGDDHVEGDAARFVESSGKMECRSVIFLVFFVYFSLSARHHEDHEPRGSNRLNVLDTSATPNRVVPQKKTTLYSIEPQLLRNFNFSPRKSEAG